MKPYGERSLIHSDFGLFYSDFYSDKIINICFVFPRISKRVCRLTLISLSIKLETSQRFYLHVRYGDEGFLYEELTP